jgi:hypothetical protein
MRNTDEEKRGRVALKVTLDLFVATCKSKDEMRKLRADRQSEPSSLQRLIRPLTSRIQLHGIQGQEGAGAAATCRRPAG